MDNAQDVAFPVVYTGIEGELKIRPGMTKREYIAALVLAGIVTRGDATPEQHARYAIRYTDELLKQLET